MTAAPTARDDELNPLVEIEQRVQARAKDLALDMGGPVLGRRVIAQQFTSKLQ